MSLARSKVKSESVSHSVVSGSLRPMNRTLPGSSVHGVLQARILEWAAIPFSRWSCWPRDQTCISHRADSLLHCRQILYHLSHQGSPTCKSSYIIPCWKNSSLKPSPWCDHIPNSWGPHLPVQPHLLDVDPLDDGRLTVYTLTTGPLHRLFFLPDFFFLFCT